MIGALIVPTVKAPVFPIVIAAGPAPIVVSVPLCVNGAPPLSIRIVLNPALTVVPASWVSGTVLNRVKSLTGIKPVVVKLPKLLTRLAPVRRVAPNELPVSVPAVTMPLSCVMPPAEVRVTVLPLRSPPSVNPLRPKKNPETVCSVRSPAELTVPVVVSACASVKLNKPLPVLLKPPKVLTRLAWVRFAPPTELPLSLVAVMAPPVWLIVPAELSVTFAVPALTVWFSVMLPEEVVSELPVVDSEPLLLSRSMLPLPVLIG